MRSLVRSPKVPKGYYFKIHREYDPWEDGDDYTIEVELFHKDWNDGKRSIGGVTLQKAGETKKGVQIWETHSSLSSLYWNKKLGVSMYVRAIKWCLDRGYKVCSSDCTSDMAENVWTGKTIRKYVHIIKRKRTVTYNGYYGNDTHTYIRWHAFAKKGTR